MPVNIRQLRKDIKDSGLTQVEIASKAGYRSKSTITLLMRGRSDGRAPSLHAIHAVAAVLGYSMSRYTNRPRRQPRRRSAK